MKKNLFVCFFLLMIASSAVFSSSAAVVDNASLFTAEEVAKLEATTAEMEADVGATVLILTTAESYSGSRDNYVEGIYYDMGYDADGIVLHIDMFDRFVAVQLFEGLYDQISQSDQDYMYEQVVGYLRDGDYYGGASYFANNTARLFDGTISHGFTFIELLIIIPIAILIFCGIFFGVKFTYGSDGKDRPYPFRERASHQLTTNHDQFIRQYTVTTVVKSSSGGGGHSSGGSSRSSGGHF